jgi:N-acetyl-gamma-glutamyl-phosphate reductase
MKKVGLVGVTGYTGMELARLLTGHDSMELVMATSRSEAGKQVRDLFPHLAGRGPGEVMITGPDPEILAGACDLVFLAVPHGTAMDIAADLLEAGVPVVDFSADYRIRSADVYAEWYGLEHTHPELLGEAVYGLVELYADKVRGARLVANPGCYPSSVVLGLVPALRAGLVDTEGIVADSKSGVTGAGRGAKVGTLFSEVSDNFRAYNLGGHRHTPEIEQELSLAANADMRVSFNTHLLPVNRGILSTIYCRLKHPETADPDAVQAVYEDFASDRPWIRVCAQGRLPEIKNVRGTMYCDIGLIIDPRTERLIIVTAIDNLCRGAAGQALANANLMLGLPVDAGLDLAPLVP